jgi:photosystem II stability/assembly factor-like uncharacterized protein
MAELTAYTSKDGALWVFPDGPNHAGAYVGCVDADDISEPKGDVELIRCFDVYGNHTVVGNKVSPPDPVTTSLTALTYRTRSLLEKIRCEYGLMFLQRDGGRADLFCNRQRALILSGVRNTEKTYGGILKREEDVEATRGMSISANPPVIDAVEVEGRRKSVAENDNFNDVFMLKDECATTPVLEGVAVADYAGLYAAGMPVWLTHDGGQTWTATANAPFAAAKDIQACVLVDLCNDIRRILVAELAPAGAQGHVAYSDDDGVTWTEVHIGGAAAGHGATHGGALWVNGNSVWLASAEGYIYKSEDAGATWTAVEAGTITTDNYSHVVFTIGGMNGYAAAENGVVAKTANGGTSWSACTVVAGTPDLLTADVKADSDYVWVGDSTGGQWFSEDGGTTWTQRTGWTGSGSYAINDISFVNDWVGFMAAGLKVYRTIDGGYTWDMLTADTNAGIGALVGGDENYAVYVGSVYSGTGFIGVIEE